MENINQEPEIKHIHQAEKPPLTDNNVDFDKPYIKALLNPNIDEVKKLSYDSNWTILDIGCGNPPRLSFDPKNDLVIGCEPILNFNPDQKTIMVRKPPIEMDDQPKKVVIYKDYVERTASRLSSNGIYPDVLISVAPNPADIKNGEIFNDESSFLIDPKGKLQVFMIAIEKPKQTHEGTSYLGEAKEIIRDWMKDNGFREYTEDPGNLKDVEDRKIRAAMSRFHPNSGDLREDFKLMTYFRNSSAVKTPDRN